MRHWLLLRLRYWRLRALHAERELVEVKADALAEVYRNREREDTFASAAILGSRNMYGMPPRTGPARQRQSQLTQPIAAPNQWDMLSWADKQEFEIDWIPAGEAQGFSRQKIQQDFLKELASRRIPLNDEFGM